MKRGFPSHLNYMHPDPEIDLEGSGLLIARSRLIGRAGTASQEGFRSTPSGLEVPTTLCRWSRPWMKWIGSWSHRAENPVSIERRGWSSHVPGRLFLPD